MPYLDILVIYKSRLEEIDKILKYKIDVDEQFFLKVIELYESILNDSISVAGFTCRNRQDAKKDSSGFLSLLYWRIAALKKLLNHSIYSTMVLTEVLESNISGISVFDSKNNKNELAYKNFIVTISNANIYVHNTKLK